MPNETPATLLAERREVVTAEAASLSRAKSGNVSAGWTGISAGVVSGVVLGIFFHRDDFLGGYDSFSRRLVRLGHISLFGLGILNLLYGLSTPPEPGRRSRDLAGLSLIVGAMTMPAVCFLTAWRKPMRHLFAIPVIAVLLAVLQACWRSLRREP